MTEGECLLACTNPLRYGAVGNYDNDNCLDTVIAAGVQDLRHDVGETNRDVKDSEANIRREVAKSEADIRADVHAAECSLMNKIGDVECSITREVLETKHTLAKDILRAEYESKLATQAAIKEINEKVDKESERTNDKVLESRNFNAEKFCMLENEIKLIRTKSLEDKVLQQSQDLQTAQLLKAICCGCGTPTVPVSGK